MGDTALDARQKRAELWKSALFRWLVFAQLLILFAVAYVKIGGLLIAQTNRDTADMFGGDQMHNMRLATITKDDLNADFSKGFSKAFFNFFPHRTDGVVQPLWPWVAAWFTDNDHKISDETMQSKIPSPQDVELFNRGRWFHVFMTCTFLVFLGVAACRIFSFPAACNLVLLAGFGSLLPRSAYFQPEPLFFVFFFLTWVACVSALAQNSLWSYVLIGILSGLAYMTKGSVHPLLGIFIGVSSLRCIWEIFSARRRGFVLTNTNLWYWRNHVVGLVMLAMAHLMTIGPRLTDSYEKFGDPFHAFPSYWMWFDRFEPDAYQWMDEHNSKEELAAMLPADKPSLGKYLRTHTREEVTSRLTNGVKVKLSEFLWPKQSTRSEKIEKQKPWRGILEWRGIYLGALAVILLGMVGVLLSAAPKPEHAGHVVFRHGTVAILLFTVGSFVVYTLAYGWYTPIGRGDRFMMSLYLPVAFSLIWGSESILKRVRRRHGSPWIFRGYLAAHWLLFAVICWRLVEILRFPWFRNS